MFWHEEMNEQARLAGLLMEDLPRWETKEYELRGQWKHAAVVVHAPHNEKDEIVVLLGGNIKRSSYPKATNTVSLRKSDGSLYDQCPRGPSMNEEREGLAAVVYNGYVYAIGGRNRDSMERIQVSDLLSSASLNKTEKETPWKTLTCRLSATHVWSSSAAVVQNRYIVIGGGNNGNVDIVDISEASQPFIFQAPSLTVPRYQIGMAAIGSRVYVIGGYSTGEALKKLRSVEYLDMLPDSGNDGNEFEESTIASSLSWKMHKDLVLPVPRVGHSVVRLGTCLVVAGGRSEKFFVLEDEVPFVEVLDTKRNKVWRLPQLRERREKELTAVVVSNELVLLGGDVRPPKTFLRLLLTDKNSAVHKRLLDSRLSREFD